MNTAGAPDPCPLCGTGGIPVCNPETGEEFANHCLLACADGVSVTPVSCDTITRAPTLAPTTDAPTATDPPTSASPTPTPTNMVNLSYVELVGYPTQFNGVDTGFAIEDFDGIDTDGSFTVAALLQQNVANSGYIFAKVGANGYRHFSLYSVAPSNQLAFLYISAVSGDQMAAHFILTGAQNITSDNVHMLMLLYSQRVLTLYIDGVEHGAAAIPDGVADCGAPSPDCVLLVGKRVGGGFFQGIIYDARLYEDTALTQFPALSSATSSTTLTTATTSTFTEAITESPTAGPIATPTQSPTDTTPVPTTQATCTPVLQFRTTENTCQDVSECYFGCNEDFCAGGSLASICGSLANCVACVRLGLPPAGPAPFSVCAMCSAGKYLYEGECHDDCSSFPGTIEYGGQDLNRSCAAVTPEAVRAPAPSAQYEMQSPTATSDRDCQDVTPDSACVPGDFVVYSTPTEDTQCVPCPAGFSDHDSLPTSPCQQCSAGQYTQEQSVGVCSSNECPVGTSDLDSNASTPCDACSPGQYVPQGMSAPCEDFRCTAGTTDADGLPSSICELCPPGTFVPVGSSGPCSGYMCAVGSVDADSNSSTECVQCNGSTEYQNGTDYLQCQPVHDCSPGFVAATSPTMVCIYICTCTSIFVCVLTYTFI